MGARLTELTQEHEHRFRLSFASEAGDLVVIACLGPGEPWAGEATRRWHGPQWSPAPWLPPARHALIGRRVESVVKAPADRSLFMALGGGRGIALELAPRHANFVVLGENQVVVAMARHGKTVRSRLTMGQPWSPPPLPVDRIDPFSANAAAIGASVHAALVTGESMTEAVLHRLSGIGPVGASLIAEECLAMGRPAGDVVRERLDEVLRGASEVLIETPPDRLLPWRPPILAPGRTLVGLPTTGATIGRFHEARDEADRTTSRITVLGRMLRDDLNRTRHAEGRAHEGLKAFDVGERFKLMGESLLAGLKQARRSGEIVLVPDPYAEDGAELPIPAPPGRTLTQVADDLFARHRRAQRGLTATRTRIAALARRSSRLEALLVEHERAKTEDEASALEAHMRAEGLPVGLGGPTRAARSAARVSAPELTGVRIVTSEEGFTILIGRTGKDNDKLTFKIAAPDDVWLHAAGVPGAHVIIRNPERLHAVPQKTLGEAARLALWYSDARAQGSADVQWTRRKNVRRAKGGTSGMVVLKRFETLRVRAQRPAVED